MNLTTFAKDNFDQRLKPNKMCLLGSAAMWYFRLHVVCCITTQNAPK